MTRSALFAAALATVLGSAVPVRAQSPAPSPGLLAVVQLPAELDRVLRDYETAWRAQDADGLATLFTDDGFILRPGLLPVRGREAIREAYAGSGGPLVLKPWAFAIDGNVGWIVGGYSGTEDGPDFGKYTLTLRRGADGRWAIASDMDNGNGG